jgi:hypothetical protein
LTTRVSPSEAPATASASTGGLPDSAIAADPPAPGVKTSMRTARTTSTPIAATIPRGIARAGSRASSAASGTLSTARKNQIAKGNAAQMPSTP